MPSITQIEYILAVHKSGHFGRASEELGISQPTLSSQIQKAEQELNIVIFDRQSKPIALTESGQKLIELARDVVVAHQKFVSVANQRGSELSGEFTLGVIPTLASYVLPWFLGDFVSRFPKVQLSILERTTAEIMAAVSDRQMDAGILATPLGESSFREKILFYDPFYLYSHPDEDILGTSDVDVSAIDSKKLWLLEDGHCFRDQVINLCGVHEHVKLGSVSFSGGSFETLRHLIDGSGGYTFIPESYARTLPANIRIERVRPFQGKIPTREVSLINAKSSWKGEISDALSEVLWDSLPTCFAREAGNNEVLPIWATLSSRKPQ